MTYLRTGLTLTSTLALTVSYLPHAFAQEGGGRIGTLSFAQGVELDLGGGGNLTTRTKLGLGLESRTRTEVLRFDLGTELQGDLGGSGGTDLNLENTNGAILYTRRGADSSFSFSGRYLEQQLSDSVVITDPSFGLGFGLEPDTLVVTSEGSVATSSLSASLSMGIDAPFGVDLQARWFDRTYTNTVDPDLFDRSSTSLDGVARFRINPTLTARALAGVSDTTEEDTPQREIHRTYVGLGLGGGTRSGLSFTGDVLFDQLETTYDGTTTVSDDGVGLDVKVSQERPRGRLGFTVSSRLLNDGRRSTAAVNRSFAFPTGEISMEVGLVDQEQDTSTRPTASLAYRRETPVGGLTASLQHVPTMEEDVAYSNTTLALNFTQEINAYSDWAAGLAYSSVNQLGGTDDDKRTIATVSYSRLLTEDWRMNTGIEHLRESLSGGDTDSSNTLFFNIERDFSFGF